MTIPMATYCTVCGNCWQEGSRNTCAMPDACPHGGPGGSINGFSIAERSSLDTQIGGDHYRRFVIQPVEFIIKNKLPFAEGNIIKYVCRHPDKGGEEDVRKVIHYAEHILQFKYGVKL